MKYLILTLIGLVVLFILSSCGLIYTLDPVDEETRKVAKEYSGIYVFDKKLRDEMYEINVKRYEFFLKEYDKALESKGIKKESTRKVKYGSPLWKQLSAISKDFERKLDETYPKILSNGCVYSHYSYSLEKKYKTNLIQPHLDKIKEYMGKEAFDKLSGAAVISVYIDKNDEIIPLTIQTSVLTTKTTYTIPFGDDKPGWDISYEDISGKNVFYLENGKFVKGDAKDYNEMTVR